MPNKIAAAAAAKVQLQQQYPFESIQNVKLPLSTKFDDNKWITSPIFQFAAFTSLISWKSAAKYFEKANEWALPQPSVTNIAKDIRKTELCLWWEKMMEK